MTGTTASTVARRRLIVAKVSSGSKWRDSTSVIASGPAMTWWA